MEAISAVLLNWKRPKGIRQVIEHLSYLLPEGSEIIVWDNSKKPLALPERIYSRLPVRIIGDGYNRICYGRFLAVEYARNELVYTQDDDVIVNNWHRLRMDHRPGWITANRSDEARRPDGVTSLIGHGAFFEKQSAVNAQHAYQCSGMPLDFAFLREWDRLFTGIHGLDRIRNRTAVVSKLGESGEWDIERIRDPVSGIFLDSMKMALWKHRDHEKYHAEAIERVRKIERRTDG